MINFKTISTTHFNFPNQKAFYKGKVRDVYNINNELLIMIASDRISAFDVVLPRQIPFKGQILNQIAAKMLIATKDIVPNWLVATPDPNVAVGLLCEPFKVEMVIRGFLTGHAARTYHEGKRVLCGVELPNGMKENQAFEKPIITPTTKAADGDHDEDISRAAIIAKGIVSEEDYIQLEKYTHLLFKRGTELARKQGLILVDTKYEFGKIKDGTIVLIDEIHTPDSSRYFYADGYEERLKNDQPQKQLSKEFVRQWLIENGFQGKEGQEVPTMTDEKVLEISNRYIELYEQITGEKFVKSEEVDLLGRIEKNINQYLETI